MKAPARSTGQATQRALRVFVSSTFRDMQGEREELVKRVFPSLRKVCEARGVTCTEVDLRWGVTDEQSAEGRVLPICLAEIHNCRPCFIGVLGERYGWVPETASAELLEREPWLRERSGLSVTELEIQHGVLNNPEMAEHAFFYFRNPAFVAAMAADERPLFQEVPLPEEVAKHGAREAERRAQERRDRLSGLKQRIRTGGFPVRDYSDPRTFGLLVLHDFTAVIDRVFPEGSPPEPLDREALDHAAFCASRARVYIGRPRYFRRLDAHVDGDGPPLVVLGERGSGKSSLLANWALRYQVRAPQAPPASLLGKLTRRVRRTPSAGAPVVMHFIGASPHSADWASMLRRLLGELGRRFGVPLDAAESDSALRAAFVTALHAAAARGKFVLLLDGLNQLDDRAGALELAWLPQELPANVRLIVTTLPGRSLEVLRKRGWPTLEVEPLRVAERRNLIRQYLAEYRKSLDSARTERIAGASQSANPLYLRTLLEEVRVFGIHEKLDERIGHYLAAATAAPLFEKVLARYEEDYEADRSGLVGAAMSLLWAARRGLSVPELRDLLGSVNEPLPQAAWSSLHLAAEQSLLSRSGLIGFAHDDFRQAVRERYLPDASSRHAAHRRLARYFETSDFGDRRVEEEPWQLAHAEAWPDLHALLSDLPFLERAWTANPFDVKSYWAQLEAASSCRMLQAYQPALDQPAAHRPHLWTVAKLLEQTGHTSEALGLWGHLANMYRDLRDAPNLQAVLGNRALLLKARGELDKALAVHLEEQRICLELGKVGEFHVSRGNEARILQVRGDLDVALEIYQDCERHSRATGDWDGLQVVIGNRATILVMRGELDEAMKLFREKERVCREHDNQDGLCLALNNQAAILLDRGDLGEALTLLEEQERLCRTLGNQDALQGGLGNQAKALIDRAEYAAAMALLEEKARICQAIGNREELAAAWHNQSIVLEQQGKPEAAMELLKHAERSCRELGNERGLGGVLSRQASLLFARRDLEEAFSVNREHERICRKHGDRNGLQAALGNQALILKERGDHDGAMALHKKQERICRDLGNKRSLAVSLGQQALLLQKRGDLDGAMALLKEEERLCREVGARKNLQIALGNQGNILSDRGDTDGALRIYAEQERICREIEDKEGLGIALYNQALVLRDKGESARSRGLSEEAARLSPTVARRQQEADLARELLSAQQRGDLAAVVSVTRRQEALYRESNKRADLQKCLWARAYALYQRRDHAAAASSFLESERLCRSLGDKDGLQNSLFGRVLVLLANGDRDGAIPLLKEMETLCREIGNQAALERALGNQADILFARGQYDAAMPLLDEQEGLCRVLGRTGALERCLNSRAVILAMRKQNSAALAVCRAHEAVCRQLRDSEALAGSLFMQAALLGEAFERPQEGLLLLREAHELAAGRRMAQLTRDIEALRKELQAATK